MSKPTLPRLRTPTPELWDDQRMIDLLVAMDRSSSSITEAVAQLRGLSTNDVISVDTVLLDGDGQRSFEASVPFSAVAVTSVAWGELTLTTQAYTGQRPTIGAGVAIVPAGACAVLPLAGRVLTVHGRPGETVCVILLKRALAPVITAAGQPTAVAVPIAAGVLATGPGRYAGFSLRETSGTAGATVTLSDGATGTVLESIALAAGQAAGDHLGGGVRFTSSLFAAVTGAVAGSVRVA